MIEIENKWCENNSGIEKWWSSKQYIHGHQINWANVYYTTLDISTSGLLQKQSINLLSTSTSLLLEWMENSSFCKPYNCKERTY